MTEDQKKAAFIVGGVAIFAIVIYLSRQGVIPSTAVAIQPSPDVSTLGNPPAQYLYNIPPLQSTGVDLFPVVSPPATNILGSIYGAPSFGATNNAGNSFSITSGGSNVSVGGASLISNATYGNPANNGGCCCDYTTVSGQINTGNAPTSIGQLLNWYGQSNPAIAQQMAANATGFAVSNPTIMELTTPLQPPSNTSF